MQTLRPKSLYSDIDHSFVYNIRAMLNLLNFEVTWNKHKRWKTWAGVRMKKTKGCKASLKNTDIPRVQFVKARMTFQVIVSPSWLTWRVLLVTLGRSGVSQQILLVKKKMGTFITLTELNSMYILGFRFGTLIRKRTNLLSVLNFASSCDYRSSGGLLEIWLMRLNYHKASHYSEWFHQV